MSHQTAIEMRRRFPDYLFGKVAVAEWHILAKEYGRVPEPFNWKLDIRDHFPTGTQPFFVTAQVGFYARNSSDTRLEYRLQPASGMGQPEGWTPNVSLKSLPEQLRDNDIDFVGDGLQKDINEERGT